MWGWSSGSNVVLGGGGMGGVGENGVVGRRGKGRERV